MSLDAGILAALARGPQLIVDLAAPLGARVPAIQKALYRLRERGEVEVIGEVRVGPKRRGANLWALSTAETKASTGDFCLVDSATGTRHVDVYFDSEQRAEVMRRELLVGLEDTEWSVRLVVRKRAADRRAA